MKLIVYWTFTLSLIEQNKLSDVRRTYLSGAADFRDPPDLVRLVCECIPYRIYLRHFQTNNNHLRLYSRSSRSDLLSKQYELSHRGRSIVARMVTVLKMLEHSSNDALLIYPGR